MRRAVVLLSGGLDSAVTLAEAREAGFEVHALTVRYGQRHLLEIERAAEVARDLGAASHRVVDVGLAFPGGSALTDRAIPVPKGRDVAAIGHGTPSTYVPARNSVLLALALALAETLEARDLFLGVNAVDYSGYPDCRPAFLSAFEALAAAATRAGAEGARFRVHAPLLHRSKADIVRRAVELRVDLSRTLSCYDPAADGEPCRACDACLLRARGFEEAGIPDPALALLPPRGAG
jgi:7-cyano-7-deazaguanine synthase